MDTERGTVQDQTLARSLKVKAILIVPSVLITSYSKRDRWRLESMGRALLKGRLRGAIEALRAHLLVAEVLHYADITNVLGSENTYIMGRYYSDYTRQILPRYSRYPSLCKTPLGTHITEQDLSGVIRRVDAVIVGKRAGQLGERVRALARAHDLFVVMLDHFDDLKVYGSTQDYPLTDGLRVGYDYQLYFKHDIPLGRSSETLLPLAPMPVRTESFPPALADNSNRPISVFYRGQQRLEVLRGDRAQLADLLRAQIPDAVIDNQPRRKTYTLTEYWDQLSRAKIAFTPSGKVWDSTRHAETAMFGCVPLIPSPDCETVHSLIRDGENAITYRTQRLRHGEYVVVNPEQTMNRVKECLSDERQLARLSHAWREEVLAYHTTEARARYVLKAISQRL